MSKLTNNSPSLKAAVRGASATVEGLQALKRALMAREVPEPDLLATALTEGGRELIEMAIDKEHRLDRAILMRARVRNMRRAAEVVIGSGIHAAIYSAAKARAKGVRPLCIERRERAGGSFALSRRPVFYLNSRNRVDQMLPTSGPGTQAALNLIPDGVIQPADLGYLEFQTQDVLALATRINLAVFGRVLTGYEVQSVERRAKQGDYALTLEASQGAAGTLELYTDRVIVATGLGEDDTDIRLPVSDNVFSFSRFIEEVGRADNPFPLEGWQKVAVIGAADSANVVVEYLLGQGPQPGLSPASLDTVSKITWIGQRYLTKESFEQCVRSRYAGIGRYFPREEDPSRYFRVYPQPGQALSVEEVADKRLKVRWTSEATAAVLSDSFDAVIVATGFTDTTGPIFNTLPAAEAYEVEGEPVGTRYGNEEVYRIGPAAQLAVDYRELKETPLLRAIPANSASLFRYSQRTATLARHLASQETPNRRRDLTKTPFNRAVVVGPRGKKRVVPKKPKPRSRLTFDISDF